MHKSFLVLFCKKERAYLFIYFENISKQPLFVKSGAKTFSPKKNQPGCQPRWLVSQARMCSSAAEPGLSASINAEAAEV
ncbi:MAG: hypothetical protein POG24_06535, partial [Acidocella sp.]|nr:hypothetical protein [Acidocella sp.]